MRRRWSPALQWSAVVALALLALAATPHFHDAADGRGETCVLCHVQSAPPIASCVHEDPDPAAGGGAPAHAQGCARDAQVEGHGSRAPPA